LNQRLGIWPVRHVPQVEEPTVDRDIYHHNRASERELDPSGEAGRIDDCEEIVFNEALPIARLARFDTKVVLQIGQRASPSSELHENAPCGRRKMNNGHPAPPCRDYTTQKDEQDERQMEQKDGGGGELEKHDRGEIGINRK
jgi:hypothetical protein